MKALILSVVKLAETLMVISHICACVLVAKLIKAGMVISQTTAQADKSHFKEVRKLRLKAAFINFIWIY